MRCIYCLREPPAVQMTTEHVIPEAMGATLTIGGVCKSCNDMLGHQVDSSLTEHPLFQMLRLGLQIPNSAGRLPTALKDGEIVGHSDIVASHVQRTPGEKGVVMPRPRVVRRTTPEGTIIVNVEASPEQSREIIAKIQARHLRKEGARVIIRKQQDRVIPSPKVRKTVITKGNTLIRPLLKIAYEMAVYSLGSAYLDDPRAEPLRRAITDGTISDIEGEISYFPEQSAFSVPDLPTYCHIVASWKAGERIWCSLRVFNVLEAVVLLSERATTYCAPERAIVLDPLSRTLFEHTDEGGPGMVFPATGAEIRWRTSGAGNTDIEVAVSRNGVEDTSITMSFGGQGAPDASPRESP